MEVIMSGKFGIGSSYGELQRFKIEYFPDKRPPFGVYDYGTALGSPRIGKEYLEHITRWAFESHTAPLYDGLGAVNAWLAENLQTHAQYFKDALILAYFCDEYASDEDVAILCGQVHQGFMKTAPILVKRYLDRELGRE
jgi:hypothetical protein